MTVRDFRLPDLGEGLEEAEIVSWRVAEGDRVELNQPLVEVNTAKALVEIPSPFEGAVAHVIEVGRPLVTIEVAEETDAAGEAAVQADTPEEAAQEGVQEAVEAP